MAFSRNVYCIMFFVVLKLFETGVVSVIVLVGAVLNIQIIKHMIDSLL